jgi:hypothetical protein
VRLELAAEQDVGGAPQLGVHEREYPVDRGLIAAAQGLERAGHVLLAVRLVAVLVVRRRHVGRGPP